MSFNVRWGIVVVMTVDVRCGESDRCGWVVLLLEADITPKLSRGPGSVQSLARTRLS